MLLRPFWVPVRRSFDRIAINVTAAATAASGGVLRFGAYSISGTTGTLLWDAGTISSEAAGSLEVTISQTLNPGVVWLGVVAQVAACSVVHYAGTTVNPWVQTGTGATAPSTAGAANAVRFSATSVTGALPASPTLTAQASAYPAVVLRAA